MEVPSRGLDSTNVGVIGGALGAPLSTLSSSMKAENRICRPAVPFTEATLPANVLMSWVAPHAAGNNIAAAANAELNFNRMSFIGISPVFLFPHSRHADASL